MSSFMRVYQNVCRLCIAFNSQQKIGFIINCLQSHSVQTRQSVRLLCRNVADSELSDEKVVSSSCENTTIPEHLASPVWANMKVKVKKSKEDSSTATKDKKQNLKYQGKKIAFKLRAKSTPAMANRHSAFKLRAKSAPATPDRHSSVKTSAKSTPALGDGHSTFQKDASTDSSDDDVVIIFETQRISKKTTNNQPQEFEVDDDSCSVKSVEMISLENIPLPPDRGTEASNISFVPSRKEGQQAPQDASARDQTNRVSNLDHLEQRFRPAKPLETDLFADYNKDVIDDEDDDEPLHMYDYGNEVKEQAARVQSIRKWENTNLGNELTFSGKQTEGTVFSVMSYNVLAQELLEGHEGLYSHHDRRSLTWEHRSRSLLKEFREANADVLCLQEVQGSHLEWYNTQLSKLGYEGLFKKRTSHHPDGCAIYFKRDRFRLMEKSSVEYYQPGVMVLDRDNVGLIARFQVVGSEGQQIVVATTHLLFNPRRHDVKLAQMQLLLTELERICYHKFNESSGKPIYRPVIVTGDLNLQPYTAVYHFLTDGFIDYSILSARTLQPARFGFLQQALLPPDLLVSNTCQHLGIVKNRQCWRHDSEEGLCKELRLVKPFNSDNIAYLKKHESCNPDRSFQEYVRNAQRDGCLNNFVPNFNSVQDAGASTSNDTVEPETPGLEPGMLSHCFHLKSVYKHQKRTSDSEYPSKEATSHQQDWVTVDYIFYSGQWNENHQTTVEGSLKLLSRYGLPTREQCQEYLKHIPNLACGSDHLPLMARFLLRP